MPGFLGALRRQLLAPSLSDVTFERRGFRPSEPAVTRRLEAIPQAVVVGFEAGVEARDLREIERRVELLSTELRGFAYEGATMALTITDQLRPRRRRRTRALLVGPAAPHLFLTYIGIGFAMARLPRARWPQVLPDLTGTPYYPALSWLAVDGYAFDLAYFKPGRWVDQQRIPRPYPWLGAADYFPRAFDQGIGRALWFIQGARHADVAAAVRRFPQSRHADLWSGVGLACAFAGGAGAAGLAGLATAAGGHRPDLAQGAVFAAKARTVAGLMPAHTTLAVDILTSLSSEAAAALVDEAVDSAPATDSAMVYEHWRHHVRRRLSTIDSVRPHRSFVDGSPARQATQE